jgi:hypothetical protein
MNLAVALPVRLVVARVVIAVILMGSLCPSNVQAQIGFVVEGRVVGADGSAGITLASVELVDFGSTLTSQDGSFRFDNVPPGGYTLTTGGFGYVSDSRFIVVDADTVVLVSLSASALPIDSLFVDLRLVEMRGTVRDPEEDFSLVDVAVLTDQGRSTRTDEHGRFDVEVLDGLPLHVTIRAFGYLPFDSVVTPREEVRYVFELQLDPLIETMVAVQVERLERRASPRFAAGYRNLNRERLIRYAGSATLWDVLLFEYGERRLERVGCILIDEVMYPAGPEARSILLHTLPEQLERIEFMFRGAMLRIYTREFMQEMIARNMPLRRPVMFGGICE